MRSSPRFPRSPCLTSLPLGTRSWLVPAVCLSLALPSAGTRTWECVPWAATWGSSRLELSRALFVVDLGRHGRDITPLGLAASRKSAGLQTCSLAPVSRRHSSQWATGIGRRDPRASSRDEMNCGIPSYQPTCPVVPAESCRATLGKQARLMDPASLATLLTPSEHSPIACLYVVNLPVPLSHQSPGRAALCNKFPASRFTTCALCICPRAATIGSCRRPQRTTLRTNCQPKTTAPQQRHKLLPPLPPFLASLYPLTWASKDHGLLNARLQIGSRHASYCVLPCRTAGPRLTGVYNPQFHSCRQATEVVQEGQRISHCNISRTLPSSNRVESVKKGACAIRGIRLGGASADFWLVLELHARLPAAKKPRRGRRPGPRLLVSKTSRGVSRLTGMPCFFFPVFLLCGSPCHDP